MTYETINYEVKGGTAFIGLNRPDQYNAFDYRMRSDTFRAIKVALADNAVKVVVIYGEGRGFSAGNDLAAGGYDPISEFIELEYGPILRHIQNSDKIFISQVHGNAAGVGAAVAMACDFVVMGENAKINMAFAAISLIPDGGTCFHLFNAMGYHRALELVVEGGTLTGAQAKDYGIANRVVAEDELAENVAAWAESLAERAPLAVSAAKRLFRNALGKSFDEMVAAEGAEQNPLIVSNDFKRGVSAFFKKEKAVFEGN